jgi:hypothetical protein
LQGVLDSRKELFEELLWEHRDLIEAFGALELSHSQCQGLFWPTDFFCTGYASAEILLNCLFCVATLPEASLDDLTSQVAALKGKPFPPASFSLTVLLY